MAERRGEITPPIASAVETFVDTARLERTLASHEKQWGFRPLIHADDAALRVEPAAFGHPRVSIATAAGAWLRVHSERAPVEEAARWLAGQPAATLAAPVVWIVGAGYGYLLDALLAKTTAQTKFVLLEPESGCLRYALSRREWTPLIEQGRLMVLAGPHYEGWTEAWRMVDSSDGEPAIVCHPVIVQARPEASRQALEIIRQAVSGARANREARRRFGGRYLLNTLQNLPLLAEADDVGSLAGNAAARPAIVAAAGPSLNRNLAELAAIPDWRERVVLIAVDTALKPCLAAGLAPHYVVAVDPGEANVRKLTDLPPAPETALVAEPSIAAGSFEAFRGRTFLFKVSDTHAPWPWLHRAGLDVRRLRAWGSVLTTAFDFALHLACDPVVFIGADLAYTNGQPHCRNTMYEKDWNALVGVQSATLEVIWKYSIPDSIAAIDQHGEPTRTSEALKAFCDWIVAQTTAARGTRFVNATGAGILHGPNIALSTLADLAAHWPPRDAASPAPRVQAAPAPTRAERLANALRTIVATSDAAADAATSASPLDEWHAFTGEQVSAEEMLAILRRL